MNVNVSVHVPLKFTVLLYNPCITIIFIFLTEDITFDHAPSPQHPEIFKDAQIECRVSGNPAPEISWRYRGEKIRPNGLYMLT